MSFGKGLYSYIS